MPEKYVSPMVVRRLPRYYRYLGEMIEEGITRVSSRQLSAKMKASASQIRQDLNCFGGFGQQGYGYNVEYLYKEIGKILGLTTKRTMVIAGVGNLGRSIAGYGNFAKRGFVLKGLFDINEKIVGTSFNGITIMQTEKIEDFVRRNKIDIGVLTMPKGNAQHVADMMIAGGVKGIWNFSHTDIEVPEGIIVENVHLSDSLMTLSCNINFMKSKTDIHTKK